MPSALASMAAMRQTARWLPCPRAGEAERDGEDGLIAMYHIHAEQQGDAQAGVLYGQFLYVAYLGHSFQIEKPPTSPCSIFLATSLLFA